MLKRAFWVLLIACLTTQALSAADDPLVGKWKLNAAKSRFPDTMKVAAAGANKYTFDFGAGQTETIMADGTDQPGIFGTTFAVTVEGADTWKVVRKKDGQELLMAIWKLSEDGKSLSDTYRQSDGVSMDYLYERKTAGTGFAATWESVSEKMNSPYPLEIEPYEGDGLAFNIFGEKTPRSVKFDGKEYPVEGPNVSPGAVCSGRRANEHAVEFTYKRDGKVRETRQVELSADGKILTMTVRRSGQEKANVFVFDRE